jgi:hypothetical protein
MGETTGHENRSAIHRRAVGQGAKIRRRKQLDEETALIEYDASQECYLYHKSVHGAYRVEKQFNFDEILKAWPNDAVDFPMERVTEIAFTKKNLSPPN